MVILGNKSYYDIKAAVEAVNNKHTGETRGKQVLQTQADRLRQGCEIPRRSVGGEGEQTVSIRS